MSKISSIYFPVFGVLLAVMLMMGGEVKGQSPRIYAQYLGSNNNTTDGTIGAGGAGGFLGTTGKNGSFNFSNLGLFNDLNYNNFTELTATSGETGSLALGAVGIQGGASSAFLILKFTGSITPQSGTPIIIKLKSDHLNLVEIQGYNNTTAFGSAQSFSSLTPGNNADEYIYFPTNTINTITIMMRTDVSNGLTAGIVSKNAAQIYYAFFVSPPILSNKTICSGTQAPLEVINPNPNLVYKWYTAQNGGNLVNTGTTFSPNLSTYTTYYVEAVESGLFSSARTPVTITINPLPTLTVTPPTTTNITTEDNISFSAVSSASRIRWHDQTGEFTGNNHTFGPFATPGIYTYNVIADNGSGTCSNSTTVTFSVYSTTACPPLTKRIYGNSSTWSNVITGSVTNPDFAADGDPTTNSTLTSALGLLGIGTVTQNIFWNNTGAPGTRAVAAGTAATIKLGLGSGLLSLASNISVVGIKKNGTSDPIEIGTPKIVDASLLKLLPGDNTFEYTIIPSDNSGPVDYDGVRIILGSLVSLGQTARVFDAYYLQSTPSVDCSKGDVTDIVYGVKDLGIGALTVTVGVNDAWKSVDRNENTFATLYSGAGILAQAREQIIFSSPSLPSDSLKIITSTGASLLGVDLLTGFSIQRYLGSVSVGAPITSSSLLLSLKLLDGGTKAAIVLAPTPQPYDRVEILYGGVAGVLNSINIHEVQRITTTKIVGSDINNNITVCQGTDVSLTAPVDECTTFKWYDAPVGGSEIPAANGLILNTSTLTGINKFYIQPVRFGCESMARGVVTVIIKPTPILTSAQTVAPVCSSTAFNYTPTSSITNTTFSWTRAAVTGISNAAVTTPTSGIISEILINTTAVPVNVVYTYYLTADGCTKEFEVTVPVNPVFTLSSPPIPSPICSNTVFNYTPTSATEDVTFTWRRPSVAGISNLPVTTETSGPISETLINTTSSPAYVTYIYSLTKNGCTSTQPVLVIVNPSPMITLDNSTNACEGIANTSLTYSDPVANPITYSIIWDAAAHDAGFLDVTNSTLPPASITVPIPSTALAATYKGAITVTNANGCISDPINFNMVVHPKLPAPHLDISSN